MKPGKPKSNSRVQTIRSELINGPRYHKMSFYVCKKLHTEFKKLTFLADMKMTDVLVDAITKFIKEKKYQV